MNGLRRRQGIFQDDQSPLERARAVYQFRRRRAEVLADPTLFGEPAYDILLDLYIAHHEGRPVSVSDACVAADVPCSTALRHVKLLEQRGHLCRHADAKDGRRNYLILGSRSLSALERLLT